VLVLGLMLGLSLGLPSISAASTSRPAQPCTPPECVETEISPEGFTQQEDPPSTTTTGVETTTTTETPSTSTTSAPETTTTISPATSTTTTTTLPESSGDWTGPTREDYSAETSFRLVVVVLLGAILGVLIWKN
jgi:hypothetical protein